MTVRYALKWVTCSGKYRTSKSFASRTEAETFKAFLEVNSTCAYRVVEVKAPDLLTIEDRRRAAYGAPLVATGFVKKGGAA